MNLREHQRKLELVLSQIKEEMLPLDILIDVVPGGGKSMLPGLLAERFPNHKIAWFVPRLSLRRQAAVGMLENFGIPIRESGNDTNPSRGTRGFVATHAALTTDPDLWRHELSRTPYLLVIDELHHAKLFPSKEEQNSMASAIAQLPYHVRLCMTGTLDTNDNSLIYNVPYAATARGYELQLEDFSGKLIRYNRQSALSEGAIVPVEFHYHNGVVKWETKEGIREVELSESDRQDESQAMWTALRTDHAMQLLDNAILHWREFGGKLLVVVADQQTAKSYQSYIRKQGISCGLAISDAADAHDDIEEFREGDMECLVTCQMAYEGLDVPEITHLVCLTHIRSRPWILQMLARAWRAAPGKTKCWAFVPDDPRMNRVIDLIRSEQEMIVPLPQESAGRTGVRGELAFVPISGQVLGVTAEMLDEGNVDDVELKRAKAQLLKALAGQFNISGNESEVDGFAEWLLSKKVQPAKKSKTETPTDTERKVRKEIVGCCNRADKRDKVKEGTYQGLLMRATGKSIKDMEMPELERARTICTQICS